MGAYEIAKLVSEEMPVKLLMNGSGPLRTLIEEKVHAEGLEIVEFIDVKAFGELDEYYQRSTSAISPCQRILLGLLETMKHWRPAVQ